MTNLHIQALLNHTFGKGAYTPPTNLYVALTTTTPTAAAAGTAPTYTGYARILAPETSWTRTNQTMSNDTAITFAACSAGSSVCTYAELWDHLTNTAEANRLYYGVLTAPVTVDTTHTPPYFPIDTLTFTINPTA
jgi:hypothetical protein